MNRVIIFLSAMLVCMCSMAQTEVKEKEFPFEFQASYVGDFAGNVVGGKQLGFGYLGYGTLGITFDTEKAGWWKGGQLVLSGATTHGTNQSAHGISVETVFIECSCIAPEGCLCRCICHSIYGNGCGSKQKICTTAYGVGSIYDI